MCRAECVDHVCSCVYGISPQAGLNLTVLAPVG